MVPNPLNTPLGHFGLETSEQCPARCVATAPAGAMVNPITGAPTIAPPAMLVDHVRAPDQPLSPWPRRVDAGGPGKPSGCLPWTGPATLTAVLISESGRRP